MKQIYFIPEKIKIMKKTIFFLLVALLTVSALHAQKTKVVTNNNPGWHKIGEATVDFKADRDAFIVEGKDKFKAIQIKIIDAPVRLEDLHVSYDDGGKEDISVRSDFNPGSESRIIELQKGTGGLNKVVFYYKTVHNMTTQKAHTEITRIFCILKNHCEQQLLYLPKSQRCTNTTRSDKPEAD